MTLAAMHKSMSAEEYFGWVSYYNIHPFGFAREEQRHSEMMSSMWILHGGKGCDKKLKEPGFWMYRPPIVFEDPEHEAQEMLKLIGG